METIVIFLADNYIWFLVITLILIFALIGYLVDTKKDERFTKGFSLDSELMQKMEVAKAVNISLNDMVEDSSRKIMDIENEEINERVQILSNNSIRNKLLAYFKIMSKRSKSKIRYLPFTFTDLADYLAINRSAMTRELKLLKEEGFIEISTRKIKLLYNNI